MVHTSVDGYGVCVCDNDFLESTVGTCIDKNQIFGITFNKNCGIGTILLENGECVCQNGHIPTENNDRCISMTLFGGSKKLTMTFLCNFYLEIFSENLPDKVS